MERSQYWMHMKREQIHKSYIEAKVGDDNNNYSWEERAFAEDASRILGGSIWPPRSYSCTFCKREFRSAQALGGHMNIHRRDRARLKQNLNLHDYEPFDDHHHHHKNDFKSILGNRNFSAADEISTQIDCCLSAYSCPATTITTTRLSPSRFSTTYTRENCGGQHNISPCFSSSAFSIILGQNMGSPNSEPDQGVVNAKECNFNGLDCNNYVETRLSMGQKSSSSGDRANISCKRLKTGISSLPVFLKPCSNAKSLAFQPAEIVHGHNHGMEDLDLELRLGKQQKVKKVVVQP